MADGGAGRGSMWTWVAVGCGGFVLLGVVGSCVGPGIFAMMFMDGMVGMVPGRGLGMPPGSIEPGTAGLDLPPAEGPLMPAGTSAVTATGRRAWSLVVQQVDGFPDIATGDVCPFEVERLPRGSGGYWCRTEIKCGETTLYGGPGQGYFDCAFPETQYDSLQAYDYGMQDEDGDPSFVIEGDGSIAIRNYVDGATIVVSGRLEDGPRLGASLPDDDVLIEP